MKKRHILIPLSIVLLVVTVLICFNPFQIPSHVMSTKDWADIVQYNGVVYEKTTATEVNSSEIGKCIGRVKFITANEDMNSFYQFKDFDATYLKKRTKLFKIKNDTNSIAALVNGSYYRYQKSPGIRPDSFGNAKIEWEDIIQYQNEKYISQNKRVQIDASKIDSEIGSVEFNVTKSVGNSAYRWCDFDASCLEVGTKLYAIKDNTNAIAALVDGVYFQFDKQKK